MHYRILLILFVSLYLPLTGISQEQLGLRQSNYAGVAGIGLNPAHNLTSKQNWDIQLGGLAAYFDNNYFFLKNTNLLELARYRESVSVIPAFNVDDENALQPNEFVIDYFDDQRTRYLGLNTAVMGPSFMVRLESGHTFGLTTGLRLMGAAQRIPGVLSYYEYDRKEFGRPFEISEFEANLLSFAEIGLNYAGSIPTGEGTMGIGITAKYLMPVEGGYFESKSPVQYTKLPGDTLSANFANLSYGYTTTSIDGSFGGFNINGNGFGLDLGVIWTIDRAVDEYAWRFGLSIVDIGVVNFNKNALRHTTLTAEEVIIPGAEYKDLSNIEDLNDLAQKFSGDALGDPNASLVDNNFQIFLPTGISFQADASINENFYVNGMIMQRLPFPGASLERTSFIAVTPRFENRWFDVGIPLSVQNYTDFRVGAYARLWFLTMGTHDVHNFLGQSNVTGGGFYASLRVPFFELGNLGGKGRSGFGKGKRNGKVKCYKF